MSGFAPFGTPIVVGCICVDMVSQQNSCSKCAAKPFAIGGHASCWVLTGTKSFLEWANQTHNACVNYCNRNATAKTNNNDLFLSYGTAVTAAMGISVAANKLVAKFKGATIISRFVPFITVASANIVNIGMMRRSELSQGISVYDIGTSECFGTLAFKFVLRVDIF